MGRQLVASYLGRHCARLALEHVRVEWRRSPEPDSLRPLLPNHVLEAPARGFATRLSRLVRLNSVTVTFLSLLGHYHRVLLAVSISPAGAIEQLKGAWK